MIPSAPLKEQMYVGTAMSTIWQRWYRSVQTMLGGESGVLPIASGGTGAKTAATARSGLGLGPKPGWTAPTGTSTRTTYATYAGQTISNPPTQAEVQAIDDHVKVLSQHLKALIDDLTALNLIGP